MVTYRCQTCGTTETASSEHLDQFWISTLPPQSDPAARSPTPLRYCGTGCLPEAAIPGEPPTLLATIQPLSQWFDAHAASHRFIALLSPT